MIIMNLPYPPSVNHSHINAHGRRFPNKKALAYKSAVAEYVIDNRVPKLGDNRIELTITVCPPDRRRRDISNIIKILEDSLVDAGVFDDDEQVDVLLVQRGNIVKNGRCTVFVEVLPKN